MLVRCVSAAGSTLIATQIGEVEAFVCRTCGRIEWFAVNPGEIEVGAENRTEVLDLDQGPPYR